MLNRPTVSIARAGELVGVSRRTIYNWIAGGKIQYVRTAGGSIRIFEDSLWREPDTWGTEVLSTGRPGTGPRPVDSTPVPLVPLRKGA